MTMAKKDLLLDFALSASMREQQIFVRSAFLVIDPH